jgi:hypothetical protein
MFALRQGDATCSVKLPFHCLKQSPSNRFRLVSLRSDDAALSDTGQGKDYDCDCAWWSSLRSAMASSLPAAIKKMFSEARPYAEGRGIRFTVSSQKDISTIKKLVEIKTTPE